jgi:DNA-binding NarL/FixJ family response regulator
MRRTGQRFCLECNSDRCRHIVVRLEDRGYVLSPQKLRVVRLVAAGRSNKEIAYELGLSLGTVKAYLSEAYAGMKLNKGSGNCRAQLANWVHEHREALTMPDLG